MSSSVAAYDLGTNSTRSLCVQSDIEKIGPENVIHNNSRITRLGEGVDESGRISDEAIDRVLEALKDFDQSDTGDSPTWVGGVATSACRRASSRSVNRLFNGVESITGVRPELISGEEEAELTGKGVRASLPESDSGVVVDIGGGSTEWIQFRGDGVQSVRSLETGVVTLLERCAEDKSSWTEQSSICVRNELDRVFNEDLPGAKTLVVVGGTGTTLAGLIQKLDNYEPSKIHGYPLNRQQIEDELNRMKNMSYDEIAKHPIILPGREDVIIPGTMILLRCMNELMTDEVIVSEYGILAGYISEHIFNER